MLGGRFIAISHLNFLSAWRVFFRKGVSQWYCHISAESTGCGMARKSQVEYPGAIYHLMNRGDRREPSFRDDEDRERFLATLGEGEGLLNAPSPPRHANTMPAAISRIDSAGTSVIPPGYRC